MADSVVEYVAARGAVNVAEYMRESLYNPRYGYYMKKNPVGAAGDFTTAPEISQMFGEVVAAWVVYQWQQMGRVKEFVLLECGGGRGTLMKDVLRIMEIIAPDCFAAAQVVMLEISPTLQEVQAEALAKYDVAWAHDLDEVDFGKPAIVLGNEFLDAFPIHQYVMEDGALHERMVGCKDGALRWEIGEVVEIEDAPEMEEGEIYEVSEALDWLTNLRERMSRGVVLMVDYGYSSGYGDSLQAIFDKDICDALENAGDADLTAHVNFAAAGEVLGAAEAACIEQGEFLTAMGMPFRAARLIEENPEMQEEIEAATYRLLHKNQMGELFKVLEWRKV